MSGSVGTNPPTHDDDVGAREVLEEPAVLGGECDRGRAGAEAASVPQEEGGCNAQEGAGPGAHRQVERRSEKVRAGRARRTVSEPGGSRRPERMCQRRVPEVGIDAQPLGDLRRRIRQHDQPVLRKLPAQAPDLVLEHGLVAEVAEGVSQKNDRSSRRRPEANRAMRPMERGPR